MSVLTINGVEVASPKVGGVQVVDTPVWSSNTGRAITGLMTGDIIGWKSTVSVDWNALSFEDAEKIQSAIKNAPQFFNITYIDFGKNVSKTVYVENIPRTLYSLASSARYYTDVSVQFIEQ